VGSCVFRSLAERRGTHNESSLWCHPYVTSQGRLRHLNKAVRRRLLIPGVCANSQGSLCGIFADRAWQSLFRVRQFSPRPDNQSVQCTMLAYQRWRNTRLVWSANTISHPLGGSWPFTSVTTLRRTHINWYNSCWKFSWKSYINCIYIVYRFIYIHPYMRSRDSSVGMATGYSSKICYKKEILRSTVSNTGIYCSSDKFGTVYQV
jgi:hypothetical protein